MAAEVFPSIHSIAERQLNSWSGQRKNCLPTTAAGSGLPEYPLTPRVVKHLKALIDRYAVFAANMPKGN